MDIWYEALVNIYVLNNGVMNSESDGVSSLLKNLGQLDIGRYVKLKKYSVNEMYKRL